MNNDTLYPAATLMDAVRVIEASAKRLAVVLAPDDTVIGTLTDGDIRRKLLQGGALETMVAEAMNAEPVVGTHNMSDSALLEALKEKNIRALPLIDGDGRFTRIVHESELLDNFDGAIQEKTFSCAVLMAGGEGTRLRPLTDNTPKPMIDINGIPLLERQVRRLGNSGTRRIFIAVNYLGDVIEKHFGDGSRFSVEIEYLREDTKLGTAGALSLLPSMPDSEPILVINGDVLTTSDFGHLYSYHLESQGMLTVGAVEYHVNIPYGVIESEGISVVALKEKPSQKFLCNAGIYALSNAALKRIPGGTHWDMTDLIKDCLKYGQSVSVFPVHEYWSDIGTSVDLQKAREVYSEENL
jgi:dTDP-glucose pyrophosphorylase